MTGRFGMDLREACLFIDVDGGFKKTIVNERLVTRVAPEIFDKV